MKTPPAPKAWATDARQLWKWVHEQFVLDVHHTCLLRRCCEMLSRASQAAAIVEKDGLSVPDRYGCPKPHPMLEAERAATNSARLLLRELALDSHDHSTIDESSRIPRGQ